jgi:hypothetical protein
MHHASVNLKDRFGRVIGIARSFYRAECRMRTAGTQII